MQDLGSIWLRNASHCKNTENNIVMAKISNLWFQRKEGGSTNLVKMMKQQKVVKMKKTISQRSSRNSTSMAKMLITKGCENNKPLKRETAREQYKVNEIIAKLSKVTVFYFLDYCNCQCFWKQVLICCMKLEAILLCRRSQSHHTKIEGFQMQSFFSTL